MNPKDYLKEVVYVPVSVENEYPDTSTKTIFYRGELDTWIFQRGKEQAFTHWLQPTEQSYLLSAEELKTLLGEAFDAGVAREQWDADEYSTQVSYESTKEEFIKTIIQ